ncbi:hypothetical protein [Devosia sp. RR2S18]|jgi:hypothetical protein|uniref:hypothetical protein n=1 Tax=Devosia rhizosphaerae TaxID=3049774 RepID=UPI00254158C2|nr:hypothetical protein [Devosia sp. RR2S18]WIJ24920.1 hypothetical protein QOV41_18215 [Devosia sp. RR2S18]HEV7291475.1 hypothetical protein [Devosia sp.]
MSKHLPPIPPENQSPAGPGGDKNLHDVADKKASRADRNFDQQGRQGNSKQNTTHQGYQQDR